MASQYETDALAAAHAAGWTATQAAQAKYPAVANAAGVTLGPSGGSPADFFWRHVKRYVAATLWQEERAADHAAKRAKLKGKIQQLTEFADVTISRVEDGESAEGPGWFVRKN